jgi:hypothetical protein
MLVGLLLALACAAPSRGQEAPKYDMGKIQLVFLRLSPEWKASGPSRQVMKGHRAFVENLVKEGRLAISGDAW